MFGLFVRKVLLAFHNLTFYGLSSAFTSLVTYVNSPFHPNLDNSRSSSGSNNSESAIGTVATTAIDAHEFLRFVLYSFLLSCFLFPFLSLPCPSPCASLSLPVTHPSLLRCIESRDYSGALASLHRYFDYCMMSGSNLHNNIANNSNNSDPNTQQQSPTPLNVLPYSILTLAKLHYYFGHTEQAIQVCFFF